MPKIDAGSLYGTLNLLILQSLAEEGALHGLGIARRIFDVSDEALRIEEGALYPALHRLERDGLLRSRWGVSEKNRRAKLYELTAAGRSYLDQEIEKWQRHTEAVSRVLGDAVEGSA